MKNRELYKATFSQLHTSVKVDLEDYRTMTRTRHTNVLRLLAATAAAAALLAAMTATALAFNLFGLRDLAFPEKTTLHVPVVDGDTGEVEYEDRVVDMISLQGYADTPESRACVEWSEFYWEYTGSHSFGNEIYDAGGRYSLYPVYDDAMAERFDEIVEKYGLKLHRAMFEVSGRDAWIELFGPAFLAENNTGYYGYRYDDGTFAFDGDAAPDGCGSVGYQFRYTRKGYFDTVALNAGDLSGYAEWDYTTANGVSLKLSLGPNRSFIWADLPEGFLFVNVLTGTEGDDTFSSGPITAEQLEQLAELFDFTVLTGDAAGQDPAVLE